MNWTQITLFESAMRPIIFDPLWKIKQHYDMFRRRQRLFVEMEQMASRPFSQVSVLPTGQKLVNLMERNISLKWCYLHTQVLVEIESREYNELSPAVENITAAPRKRKKVVDRTVSQWSCTLHRSHYVLYLQDSPSPIALEPCEGNRAAVLSLLVRLPTGRYKAVTGRCTRNKTISLTQTTSICRRPSAFSSWSIGRSCRRKCISNVRKPTTLVDRTSEGT